MRRNRKRKLSIKVLPHWPAGIIVLLVTDIARCYAGKPSTDPGGCTTNRQLLESLDRQALMDWLH